jgi:hypothetical protein
VDVKDQLQRWNEMSKPWVEAMGPYEVAAEIGVEISNLQYIRDLPKPAQELKRGRLWRADEIRDFAQVYRDRQLARRTPERDPLDGPVRRAA